MPSTSPIVSIAPDSTLSNTRTRMMRADRGALLAYTLMLAYASLNPFVGWRWPEAFTLFAWPRYVITFDVILNFAAYAPFGAMMAALVRERTRIGPFRIKNAAQRWCFVLVAGMGLSAGFESLQSFLPSRVSSIVICLPIRPAALWVLRW